MAISKKDVNTNKNSGFQEQEPLDINELLKMQLGPYYDGVSKSMKETGYIQASEALQQGQNPMQIIGTMLMMTGQGLQGKDPTSILKNIISMKQEQAKGVYGMSPTGEVKKYGEIPPGSELRSVYPEIGMEKSGEQSTVPENMEITGYELKYGRYQPIYKKQAVLKEKEKEIAKLDIKREVYKKDLDNFLMVDDVLHQARGEGSGRFGAGTKMSFEGITRDTPLGQAVASHDAAGKRLRVQLVRAAGDVGNINIVEQEAAEKLIPSKWDDLGTAEIKRAYLLELGRAIKNFDSNAIEDVLKKAQVGFKFKGKKQNKIGRFTIEEE